jgi:hypothetical protein
MEVSKSSDQSTLFAEASLSPARTSALQARAPASTGTAQAYGESSPVLLARYDRATSSWKTSQLCLDGELSEFSETWPRSGMTRSGTAYRLPPLVPLTGGTESGLLPTPTETANMLAPSMQKWPAHRNIFPTPDANCWKGGSENQRKGQLNGSLNPQWVSWLMGFPVDWCDLPDESQPECPTESPSSEPSAMPSSPRSRKS